MKRNFFAVFGLSFFLSSFCFSKSFTAMEITSEASTYKTVSESIDYVKKNISNTKTQADKRSAYIFLGSIQEQAGLYADAQKSYVEAAAINAKDASGMPKKSAEQLVIDAVRCALSVGDYSSADSYLNSDVKKSKNEKIIAFMNLYTQWSELCKAKNFYESKLVANKLESYLSKSSMKIVHPQILLTLYHITGNSSFSKKLKSDFPNSIEAGIVKGTVSVLPSPFCFFVPRAETVEYQNEIEKVDAPKNEIAKKEVKTESKKSETKKTETKKSDDSNPPNHKAIKEQLGLFRDEENAQRLVKKLKEKGFVGKIEKEVRPSGNIYYLVYVDENKDGTIGSKLRTAGFECYPLFD